MPLCAVLLTDWVLCLVHSLSCFCFVFFVVFWTQLFFSWQFGEKEHTVQYGTPLVSSSQIPEVELVNRHTFNCVHTHALTLVDPNRVKLLLLFVSASQFSLKLGSKISQRVFPSYQMLRMHTPLPSHPIYVHGLILAWPLPDTRRTKMAAGQMKFGALF